MASHRMTPRRIQRQRTKGWRMPDNTIYVGRPTRWGNPFHVGGPVFICYAGGLKHFTVDNPARAVALYRNWLANPLWIIAPGSAPPTDFAALSGLNLACWCPLDQPCHAGILLELANA